MYDIIGDVHGHADQLEALLKKLGYTYTNGAYRHSERKLISVGDLCDRGPGQQRTIDIIRAMHEADQAHVIMGNHEFNAVAWLPANTKGHELYTAIEVLSKGWELELPEGYQFLDKGNHPRTAIRTEWWRTDTTRYRDLAIGVDNLNELPEGNIPGADLPGYDGEKPLFVGHYWMKGEPSLQSPHIACVDWSVAANGLMAAYRFDGERELRDSGFVWV